MKLLVWILPAILYIQFIKQQSILNYLYLNKNIKAGIIWGLAVGTIFALISNIGHLFGIPSSFKQWDIVAINAVIVAPFVEEIVFRGVVFQELQEIGLSFNKSNIITALLFLIVHIIGWGFMGKATLNYLLFSGITVFVFGIILGFIKQQSKSLWASIICHMVNNLFSLI